MAFKGFKEVVSAIKEINNISPSAPLNSASPLGVNWTPIIQGLVSGVATSFGATVKFPSSVSSTPSEVKVDTSIQPTMDPTLLNRIDKIESSIISIESTIATLAESTSTQINNLAAQIVESNINTNNKINSLVTQISALAELMASNKSNTNNNNNGTESPPAVPQTAPSSNDQMSLAQTCALMTKNFLTKEESLETQKLIGITGPAQISTEEIIANAGFDPFRAPEEYESDKEEIEQDINRILEKGPPTQNVFVDISPSLLLSLNNKLYLKLRLLMLLD
jgi:hypothetical protein